MPPSLKLSHAQALAAVEKLGPFERIAALAEMTNETRDMERVLKEALSRNIHLLRNEGGGFDVIAGRTGIERTTVMRMANLSYRAAA